MYRRRRGACLTCYRRKNGSALQALFSVREIVEAAKRCYNITLFLVTSCQICYTNHSQIRKSSRDSLVIAFLEMERRYANEHYGSFNFCISDFCGTYIPRQSP